ncbi:MAG: TetR/AcrR family transcriptional regulator [Burkholderiales bacterium]|nr:TetR/AcrR family transcriptional regulator [Burkholderiales bacterium]
MTIRDELRLFKKERILQEAERLFYERGYHGTSLDAIAESLSMTKPFVYGAYDSKIDILVDISLRIVTRTLDTLRQARRDGGTPAEQLHRFALRFTAVVIADQAGVAVFFREEGLIPPSATRAINDLKGRFDDELAELLAQGVASGEFRLDDVRAATLAIGGMISWVYIWYRPQGRLSADAVARHMAGYALRVAGAQAPAP